MIKSSYGKERDYCRPLGRGPRRALPSVSRDCTVARSAPVLLRGGVWWGAGRRGDAGAYVARVRGGVLVLVVVSIRMLPRRPAAFSVV